MKYYDYDNSIDQSCVIPSLTLIHAMNKGFDLYSNTLYFSVFHAREKFIFEIMEIESLVRLAATIGQEVSSKEALVADANGTWVKETMMYPKPATRDITFQNLGVFLENAPIGAVVLTSRFTSKFRVRGIKIIQLSRSKTMEEV
ncbi:MAG: hypothetical protein WBJ10_11330 [Daejeonella sp.]